MHCPEPTGGIAMQKLLTGAIGLIVAAWPTVANAAPVTKTITFTAGPFNGGNNTPPPVGSVTGSFTVTFDLAAVGSQGNVTVNSLSLPYTGTVKYIVYGGGALGFASTNYLNLNANTFNPNIGSNGFAGVFYNLAAPPGSSLGTFNYSQVGFQDIASTRTLLGATVQAGGAVPEPATWGMMILGFGAAGHALRRRAKLRTGVSFA